jgi:hypothetical protein
MADKALIEVFQALGPKASAEMINAAFPGLGLKIGNAQRAGHTTLGELACDGLAVADPELTDPARRHEVPCRLRSIELLRQGT